MSDKGSIEYSLFVFYQRFRVDEALSHDPFNLISKFINLSCDAWIVYCFHENPKVTIAVSNYPHPSPKFCN